jgi:hypothetical protein
MRRIAIPLALALCLLGCTAEPIKLLTGGFASCSIRAGPPVSLVGVLIADAQSGTAINPDPQLWPGLAGRTLPVMWPGGFTGRSLFGGEVEVLNAAGEHVVTTGTRVVLGLQAEAPFGGGPYPACEGREVTGP